MARRARVRDEPDGADAGPPADPVEVARAIVLRQLTLRARTRVELERALAKRDVPEDVAAHVLDRFVEVGLINDATFAQDYVAQQGRRARGAATLAHALRAKGVDREVLTEALATRSPEAEREVALEFARRKVRSMGAVDRATALRRLAGALARRGFGPDVCRSVISEVAAEWAAARDE